MKQNTVSLWSYINSDQDLYKNPLYWPQQHALEPVASLRYIKMWKGLYCRWNPSMRPQVYLLFKTIRIILDVIILFSGTNLSKDKRTFTYENSINKNIRRLSKRTQA